MIVSLAEVDCLCFAWHHDLDWKLLEKNCQSQDIAVRKREGFNHELPSLSPHIYERKSALSQWTTCAVTAVGLH
jgi:hypothetical protein